MKYRGALAYLRSQQQANGSFRSYASPTTEPFTTKRVQPTIFQTILILDCLCMVDGAENIRAKAAQYLMRQTNEQGAWNYWEQDSISRTMQPYPDDLDDTACALAALMRHDATMVDGKRLGLFARLLIASEQLPGGPYNTWLINTAQSPQWHDVDVAVNANIGYTLSLQGVTLDGLNSYFDQAISNNALQSSYYVGELPTIYFLSRWYKGDKAELLKQRVLKCLRNPPTNALHQALLLSTGYRLNLSKQKLGDLAARLQASMVTDKWPAEALYIDPAYEDEQYYGGSSAVTTAFALEALTVYAGTKSVTAQVSQPTLLSEVRRDVAELTNSHLKQRYLAVAQNIMHNPEGNQITNAATLVAEAGGWHVDQPVIQALNLGSLNGWIAYSLYDDVADGTSTAASNLAAANVALRRSYDYFMQAADTHEFRAHVRSVFDKMDAANHWELQNARVTVKNSTIQLQTLPNYGDYTQLAERSLGHSLAASGVAVHVFGKLDTAQATSLERFFKHFLIARQLNDDAHDWQEDLQAGHLSAVVTLLLAGKEAIDVVADLPALQRDFWYYTIDTVAEIIHEHIVQAEYHLKAISPSFKTHTMQGWLNVLQSSVTAALNGRDEAKSFIHAYENTHV